jgi:hypothetical protein
LAVSETEANQPSLCEDATFGGKVCGMPTHYLVSYGGGDSLPLCLPHIMLEFEAAYKEQDYPRQYEWTVTYI